MIVEIISQKKTLHYLIQVEVITSVITVKDHGTNVMNVEDLSMKMMLIGTTIKVNGSVNDVILEMKKSLIMLQAR